MDLITFILYVAIFWLVFRLGEGYAYYRIAQGIVTLKNFSEKQEQIRDQDSLIIEEIEGHYYAYVDGVFVGQGPTMDDAKKAIENELEKKSIKISGIKLVSKG